MGLENIKCFRCGIAGHIAAGCGELRTAASEAEHKSRLAIYRQRLQNWLDGTGEIRWTPEQKRHAIENENRTWGKVKAKWARKKRTGSLPARRS
jgi:hypothetical protein